MKDQLKIRTWEELIGVRVQKIKYFAEITHIGLNDHRVFSALDEDILDNKLVAHINKLEIKWEKQLLVKKQVASKNEAENRTQNAIQELKEVDNILFHTLGIDDTIDWETLKDRSKFSEINPKGSLKKRLSKLTRPIEHPTKPTDSEYIPELTFFDKLFSSRKEKKLKMAKEAYDKDIDKWKKECSKVDEQILDYEAKSKQLKEKVLSEVEEWNERKLEYEKNKEQKNKKVDELRSSYLECDQSAVLEYCELVLNNSQYPESFPKQFELDYNPENKVLIIEYSLPAIEDLPKLNQVKFIRNELKEYYISDTQTRKMFDTTMYRITLRTIHEIFEADTADTIDMVSFNGWVNAINRGTGKKENNCILSIQAKKSEFIEVDLEYVDPKTCFKNFKGVGSSKLSGLTPIQPIMQISRTDRRFTDHYEVASGIDNSTNLASMDWEDFEHLIREVFANEFNQNGGEVKVTQASRDGGVDAIAFDPDPIRGGKIVIQAKRYTNTVGVAAIRDLYGTVVNEGATKGILVTTADYGPDSYEFAKGKPLTLMNGSNLLYLLEKHGHNARIDIKEAKKILREE